MKYIGTVIWGIAEIGVVISIVNATEYSDSGLEIPLLIIIYSYIRSNFIWQSYIHRFTTKALAQEFKKIRILLNAHASEDEILQEKDMIEKSNVFDTKNLISGISVGIIWIIAVLNLFNSM